MVTAMTAESIKKTDARRYSDGHLWFEPLNGLIYVGLTKLAIEELGEINFVELPLPGQPVKKDDVLFVLESNKASGDFIAAVDGTVSTVNLDVEKTPCLLNDSPEEQGWLCTLSDVPVNQFAALMTASQYDKWLVLN